MRLRVFFALIFILGPPIGALAGPAKNYRLLKSTDFYRVDDKGVAKQTSERIYRVLNEAGRGELASVKITFSAYGKTFELIEAYVDSAGKVTRISGDKSLRSVVKQDDQTLGVANQVEIPMNSLQVGSEVHVKYKIISTPPIGSIFSETLSISNDELAADELIRVDSTRPILTYRATPGDYYWLKQGKQNGLYFVEVRSNPGGLPAEDGDSENVNTKIMLSSETSWKQLGQLISPSYKTALDSPLPEKFQDIVRGGRQLADTKSQIEFVCRELAKQLVYSPEWSSTDGVYSPKTPAAIVAKSKGDGKDFATAVASMLRKLDLTAFPALTFRMNHYLGQQTLQKKAQFASPQSFNHAIVFVKDAKGNSWWVDPSNPLVIANLLSYDTLGNFALVLDGTSDQVVFLPQKNSSLSELSIEQTLSLTPDNSTVGVGQINMSANTYNWIGLIERYQGFASVKKLFSNFLNEESKMDLELIQNPKDKTKYTFSFRASDWLKAQKGKFRGINLFSLVASYLPNIQPGYGGDIGEPGTLKFVTHIRGSYQIDPIEAGCLVHSPWMNLDRIIEKKKTEILVTDIFTIKQRFISRDEASSEFFARNYSSLLNCFKNSMVSLSAEPSALSANALSAEKLKGPPFDAMKDTDAIAMGKSLAKEVLGDYSVLKRYRYYSAKLQQNPQNASAYAGRAKALIDFAYINLNYYQPAYLDEANLDLDSAIELSGPKSTADMYEKKLFVLVHLNKMKEAEQVFKEIQAKAPGSFISYFSAYILNYNPKAPKFAEQWLQASGKLATTDVDLDRFHSEMAALLKLQQRWPEAIYHDLYMATKHPKDPIDLHTLALTYKNLREYDEAIETEKRALDSIQFEAGRRLLADVYFSKARMIEEAVGNRSPAEEDQIEKWSLEALTWDKDHVPTLQLLSGHYLRVYYATKNSLRFMQGRALLDRAIAKDPNNPDVLKLLASYKSALEHK